MLSNITAGNLDQIQTVIDSGLIPKILDLMREVSHPKQLLGVFSIVTQFVPFRRTTRCKKKRVGL